MIRGIILILNEDQKLYKKKELKRLYNNIERRHHQQVDYFLLRRPTTATASKIAICGLPDNLTNELLGELKLVLHFSI